MQTLPEDLEAGCMYKCKYLTWKKEENIFTAKFLTTNENKDGIWLWFEFGNKDTYKCPFDLDCIISLEKI